MRITISNIEVAKKVLSSLETLNTCGLYIFPDLQESFKKEVRTLFLELRDKVKKAEEIESKELEELKKLYLGKIYVCKNKSRSNSYINLLKVKSITKDIVTADSIVVNNQGITICENSHFTTGGWKSMIDNNSYVEEPDDVNWNSYLNTILGLRKLI